MKKLFVFLFIISLSYNVYHLVRIFIGKQQQKELYMLFDVKAISYAEGLKSFKDKLEETTLRKSQHYFIHVWDTVTVPASSSKLYMTRLDSLIGAIRPKNTSVIYATEMKQSLIDDYLSLHHLSYKNGLVLCGMDDFISGIFVHQQKKQKSHPMQAVIDSSGNFIYYTTKLNEYPQKDTALIHLLQSL